MLFKTRPFHDLPFILSNCRNSFSFFIAFSFDLVRKCRPVKIIRWNAFLHENASRARHAIQFVYYHALFKWTYQNQILRGAFRIQELLLAFNFTPKYPSSLNYKYHWFCRSCVHGFHSYLRLAFLAQKSIFAGTPSSCDCPLLAFWCYLLSFAHSLLNWYLSRF